MCTLIVDSISIKFIDDSSLLYAKGNKLILRTGNEKRVNKTSTYDKIHAISSFQRSNSSYLVACSAGREVLISEVENNEFQNSFIVKISDWISSIKILNDESIALLTAHNHAARITISNQKLSIIEKLRCAENSTLYCSLIYGESWDDLIFFGGTALGELIVWKNESKSSKIIHRQFMHNGVMFSIDFNNRYLVSASDDRSIKISEVVNENGIFKLIEKQQLFGHTARVFVTRIISHDNRTMFLSAGEDSNLCVWSEKGELLSKKNISASGVIWNLDYREKTGEIVSCGSLGKLNKFLLNEILYENHQKLSIRNDEKIIPAKLKYLKNGTLVVVDNKMNIHLKLPTGNWMKVDKVTQHQNFVAIEVFENRLFLAGKDFVDVFDFSEKLSMLELTTEVLIKKILPETIFLSCLRAIHAIAYNEIVVSDAGGLCIVINVAAKSKILNIFQIPKSAEPWTTSVARIDDVWLVADRVGNLFVFQNDSGTNKVSIPVQKIWRLHGQLGVTTIQPQSDGFIKTTGNDGVVRTLFLNRKNFPPTIEVHRSEKTAVNWIGKVCSWNGKEYLLGFNDNYFAIYHHGQIVYEHRCGGRHRHWDVVLLDNVKRVNFTYIQRKQLNVVEFILGDFDYDDNDVTWHTMDCNTMEALDNGKLLISGSEDTSIKLLVVETKEGEVVFRDVATVNSHISNVKAFATVQDDNDFLIFSAGGRAQIVVTRLVERKFVKEEISFKLNSQSENRNSSFSSNLDAETRFTSIFYEEKLRNLYVACSDGFLRILRFTKTENCSELRVIKEHFYGKCLLKVHVVKDILLTMATDGFVCFWAHDKLSDDLRLIDRLKHNQSGINCFDVFKYADGSFLIGTSGDDNGIFITRFEINGEKIKFHPTKSNCNAHTAQVTGLKFIAENFLFTTSVDQTICKLEVIDSVIKVVDKKFTCISDVKGFVFLQDENIVVFGAGLEIVKITS